MRGWRAAVLAIGLAACGQGAAPPSERFAGEVTASAPVAAMDAPEQKAAPQDGAPPAATDAADVAPLLGPLLAYEHRATLELPADAVETVIRRHEDACRKAGPQTCLVVAASVEAYGDDVRAALAFRAEPQWLARFRAGLEDEAKGARGRVRETAVTTEDLTSQIVDGEARLRALETLRGRLETLLRTRPGKLSELLETERELARVQGELDAARATLAIMKKRVAMSLMTLDYQSRPLAVAGGTFSPILDAGRDFFRILAEGVGALIRAIAALLPWAAALALILWLARPLARRLRAPRLGKRAPSETPTP